MPVEDHSSSSRELAILNISSQTTIKFYQDCLIRNLFHLSTVKENAMNKTWENEKLIQKKFILGPQPQIEVNNREKDIVRENKNTHANGEFLASISKN